MSAFFPYRAAWRSVKGRPKGGLRGIFFDRFELFPSSRVSRGAVIYNTSSRYCNCTPPGRARGYAIFLFILIFSSLLLNLAPIPDARAYTESERNVKLDAPFVPTPNYVIAEILSKARVGKEDILYDLGSGDGRIVIEAAKQTGCRAVGIEIDPDLVEDSLRAAERAGVQDRVRFVTADIFTADFSEATVVTIYMGGQVNLKLRPRLLRELKPGTRIASYCFDMDDWKPDAVSTFGKEDAYFWVIPANASGTWQWTEGKGKTNTSWQLEIKQVFQEISGFVTYRDKQYPLRDGKVTGEGIRFALDGEAFGKASPVVFSGRIQGNEIEGAIGGKGSAHLIWRATRHTDATQDVAR